MSCAACGAASPPGSLYCLECGRALEIACPACGVALPSSARFCNACGATLGSVPAKRTPPRSDPRAYTPKHLAEKILTLRAVLERFFLILTDGVQPGFDPRARAVV